MKFATETLVLESVKDLRAWQRSLAREVSGPGEEKPLLGFVPTMGALHDGHMTLARRAVRECRHSIVSIFVNPLQFGPNEDFDRYPRTFEQDLRLCQEAGVSAVFHPSAAELFEDGTDVHTKVVPPARLTDTLCGSFRPGHFVGVATIVLKLFAMVQPDQAYFGEKDFQQLTIIRQMTKDLSLPVEVVGAQTVRESDGLAMSSRNIHLTSDERKRAPELYRALCFVREESLSGRRTLSESLKAMREKLAATPEFSLQYLEACNPETLEPLTQATSPMVLLVAARVGRVRLIDNILVR